MSKKKRKSTENKAGGGGDQNRRTHRASSDDFLSPGPVSMSPHDIDDGYMRGRKRKKRRGRKIRTMRYRTRTRTIESSSTRRKRRRTSKTSRTVSKWTLSTNRPRRTLRNTQKILLGPMSFATALKQLHRRTARTGCSFRIRQTCSSLEYSNGNVSFESKAKRAKVGTRIYSPRRTSRDG